MHAADAAGGENVNTRPVRNPDSRGNSRRSVPSPGDGDREIARADFPDVVAFGNLPKLFLVQANAEFAVKNCNGCGRTAVVAYYLLQAQCSLKILRTRQPVRNHG